MLTETRTKLVKTEIGNLPVDWEIVKFSEVFQFLRNATYSRDQLTDSQTIGYIHYGDIHTQWNFFLDLDSAILPTITNEQLKSFSLLQDGDLVMADASEDYSGLCKTVEIKNVRNRKVISGLHTIIFRDKTGSLANGFKGYIISMPSVRKQLEKQATGMKVFGVSKSNLANVQIPIPPTLTEQTAIATALSDADALIDSLEKLIEKKKNIRQSVMQELLRPKKGWVTATINEVADVLDNLRVPLNDNQRTKMRGSIPYCGANGIVDYINDFLIDDDIILMAEDGGFFEEYRTRPIAYRMKGKCWVNNHAHILKAKSDIDQGFLYYSLVHKNILSFINGGTRAKLNKSDLLGIVISLPKFKVEQESISDAISQLDREIETLINKLEKMRMIKQGMMQQLLTGKIRLV